MKIYEIHYKAKKGFLNSFSNYTQGNTVFVASKKLYTCTFIGLKDIKDDDSS